MNLGDWRPPADWQRVRTIDLHTAGEPFRIVVDGGPELEGATILDCRRAACERFDHLRTALMWEPRGHADMYGCILTRPFSDGADFGVLFTHNEGYSSMCGHGIIAMATAAVASGMVPATEPETAVGIDSPAGLVRAFVRVDNGKALGVRFLNVPSFVVDLDAEVEVPDLGRVRYDLAYGGAFYAFVDAADLGLRCDGDHVRSLIEAGIAVKKAVMASVDIVHPFEEDLGFLYGVIFVEPSPTPGVHSRNCCIFADGEVDRSPTGTGVSARLALHFAKGEIALGEEIVIESLIGSSFAGRVVEETVFGPHPAVVPEVSGRAHITGRHEFVLDPDDDLVHGFMLR